MHNITISTKDFIDIKDKAIIIDVRTQTEYKTLPKIENSINVHITYLIDSYIEELEKKYDKNALIVTVCNAGNRSSQAAEFLRERGFKNAYVLGRGVFGYINYKK